MATVACHLDVRTRERKCRQIMIEFGRSQAIVVWHWTHSVASPPLHGPGQASAELSFMTNRSVEVGECGRMELLHDKSACAFVVEMSRVIVATAHVSAPVHDTTRIL
jgi:hypothetical protein